VAGNTSLGVFLLFTDKQIEGDVTGGGLCLLKIRLITETPDDGVK
jgi:hypothetical protein